MMVIYLPVKCEFDWTKYFELLSPETETLMNRQTKNRQTNRQMIRWSYSNIESNLAVKFEFNYTNRF